MRNTNSRMSPVVVFLGIAAVFFAAVFFAAAGLLGLFGCGGRVPLPPVKPSCQQWQALIEKLPAGEARDATQAAFDMEFPGGCAAPPVTPPPEEPPTTTTTTTTTTPSQPPAQACLPDQAGWVAAPDQSAVRLDAVRAALDVVRAEHPDWFIDAGARLANRSSAGVDALYDEMGRVAARSGLCAGQLRENGGRLDKFGIMQPAGAAAEAYHLVEYGGFRIQNPIKVNSVWVPPAGQPPVTTPTPAPTPTVTPTPAAGACPAPRPETFRNPATKQDCTYAWGLTVGRKWVDATLTVTRCCDFCKAIGMGEYGGQQRCTCPLRPEGNPERAVCEVEMGAVWTARGGQLVPNPDNPAQANCEGQGCQVRVCTTGGAPCSEWKP